MPQIDDRLSHCAVVAYAVIRKAGSSLVFPNETPTADTRVLKRYTPQNGYAAPFRARNVFARPSVRSTVTVQPR
jgi:hypothetical protein